MKLSILNSFLVVALLAGFVMLVSSGCKTKDDEITCIVTVKYQADTNVIVPFADIVIGKDYDDVKVTGKTDATGMFTTTFKLEAILDVVASKDTNTTLHPPDEPVLTGVAVVRLRPGETATKTVFIN
jgi:hypothetical protein